MVVPKLLVVICFGEIFEGLRRRWMGSGVSLVTSTLFYIVMSAEGDQYLLPWGGARKFNDWVLESGVIDAGFEGYPFTWKRGTLEERLDRAMINLSWRLRFFEARVIHLHKLKSDHCPILNKRDSVSRPNRNRRPFRLKQPGSLILILLTLWNRIGSHPLSGRTISWISKLLWRNGTEKCLEIFFSIKERSFVD